MFIEFRVKSGNRSMSLAFYKRSVWWDEYYWEGMNLYPKSHRDLAEDLEDNYGVQNAFADYLTDDSKFHTSSYRREVANNITQIFYGELIHAKTIGEFKQRVEKAIQLSWRYWLKNNLGRIYTGNQRSPLVDTMQFLNSLSFHITHFSDEEKEFLTAIYGGRLDRRLTQQDKKVIVSFAKKEKSQIFASAYIPSDVESDVF